MSVEERAEAPSGGLADCCKPSGSCGQVRHINNLIENAYRAGRSDQLHGLDVNLHGLLVDSEMLDALRTAALADRPGQDAVVEAMKNSHGICSGPDGRGTMRVVVQGFPPGDELKLFGLLSAALSPTQSAEEPENAG